MKKFISIILVTLMIISAIPIMGFATINKPALVYDTGSGSEKTLEANSYNYITSDTTELTEGWWVVYEDTTTKALSCTGNVNLLIFDCATLTVHADDEDSENAGIYVPKSITLTIYGQREQTGTINAYGGLNSAGIGCGSEQDAGVINIRGCIINAYGGVNGSGIGSGFDGFVSLIEIYSGEVNAYGGVNGAGIGCGFGPMSCRISIDGGLVKAYGGNYSSESAVYGHSSEGTCGIGCACATIYLNGGYIYATGGVSYTNSYGTGIGTTHGSIEVSDCEMYVASTKSIENDRWYSVYLRNVDSNKLVERMKATCPDDDIAYVKVIEENHKHDYKIFSCTSATCTENGKIVYRCKCGETKEEIVKSRGGHAFINYIYNNDETCTTNGTETAKCIYCDATDTREVEDSAFGHVEGMTTYVDTKVATCTEDGIRTEIVYCTCCGEEISRQSRYLSALGHNTTIINQKDATEDEDGYTGDVVCVVCNQVLEYGKVIEKLEKKTEETTEDEESTNAEETTENTTEKKDVNSIFETILNFFKKIINFIKNMF